MKGEKINLQSFQKNMEQEINAVKTNFINATSHAELNLKKLGSFIKNIVNALTHFMGTSGKVFLKIIGYHDDSKSPGGNTQAA